MRRGTLVIGLCVLIANPAAVAPDRFADADISAAKKKNKQARKSVYPAPELAARRGWFDPSLGPDGRPWPNPIHRDLFDRYGLRPIQHLRFPRVKRR